MQQPFDADQAPEAVDPLENRLRSMEASIDGLRQAIDELRSMEASSTAVLDDHIRNTGQVGQIVKQTALSLQECSVIMGQMLTFLRSVLPEIKAMKHGSTDSELARPVPDRGMPERAGKDAATKRLRKDLLVYGLPLLGIVVVALALLPLRLPLAWVAPVYIVLILGGGSWATAWVVSAFRELLKRPRRQQ